MIDTYDNTFESSLLKQKADTKAKSKKRIKKQVDLQRKTVVPPRTIVIFVEEYA